MTVLGLDMFDVRDLFGQRFLEARDHVFIMPLSAVSMLAVVGEPELDGDGDRLTRRYEASLETVLGVFDAFLILISISLVPEAFGAFVNGPVGARDVPTALPSFTVAKIF